MQVDGEGINVASDAEEVSAGSSLLDATMNLRDASRSYAANSTASLQHFGNISLAQLFPPHAFQTTIVGTNLRGGSGLTTTRFSSRSGQTIPYNTLIEIDINEVNSRTVSAGGTGNSSRELYVTLLHEFAHALIDRLDLENGENPDNTTEDEAQLDDFANALLNAIEEAAAENDESPYKERSCYDS